MIIRIPNSVGAYLFTHRNIPMTTCKIPHVYIALNNLFSVILFPSKQDSTIVWYISTNPRKDNWKEVGSETKELAGALWELFD